MSLPILDLLIIVAYLISMIGIGVYFSRKNSSSEQFTTASGKIPGWALGLSFYATFLSAITFLGDPGKSFAEYDLGYMLHHGNGLNYERTEGASG